MIIKISAFIMSVVTVLINLFGTVACSENQRFGDISLSQEINSLCSIDREEFSCERDGLTIRGTVFLPEGKTDCPIAVISHGFMANQLFSQIHAQNLAKMGYAAFCFDFCGGTLVGSSEGSSTDMSAITETEDLKAVIAYAKAQDFTDPEELILLGCSQGGFVSALTAAELRQEVDALILLYPALCIPDDARSGQMMFAKFDPQNVPETFWCGPMKLGRRYVTDVVEMDPYEIIGGYTGQVLIIHGNQDNIVDLSYSQRAVEVYNQAGAQAELRIIDGGGHMFFKPTHAYTALGYIREYVDQL
ncbi:MAG: alpha/beta fold hydrolase [Oscillospiraceae bacterium]|nr:alpha/beta fold hydrolase [Oscillospiraceae bacterium]MDD6145692.1 alpha/beta fold hydrolase [Oscillospiraceae bacterium]